MKLLLHRLALPVLVVGAVATFGLLGFAGGASADSSSGGAIYKSGNAGESKDTAQPPSGPVARVGRCKYSAFQVTSAFNSGNPRRSSYAWCINRHLTYGNSAITYENPPASFIPAGKLLFEQNCSTCHGRDAGGTADYPNLQGVGAATVDFWVSTGRMPASDPDAVQASRKPPRLTPRQALEVAAFVNSLYPATPAVPTPNLRGADLADGADLFSLNCAACHTITGAGDALALSTFAPTLHIANAQQVVEAVRTGPGNMPRFTGNLNDAQVRDIAAYVVDSIQHPANPGGNGLGGVGPVAEGFIGLLFGVGIFALICFWIGERAK